MKKLPLLFFILFMTIAAEAQIQVRMGIQASPIFTANRVRSLSDTLNLTPDGARLRMMAGPIFDFMLRENYYFSTGILYAPKIAGFNASFENNTREFDEQYVLQYLRVPLTFRLFTNEISLDNRLYVQLGLTADIKIYEEADSKNAFQVNDFTLLDGTALIGLGLEHRIGYNTTIFAGFSYSRGLVNTVSNHVNLDGDIKSRNDIFSLDMGIFF
jgi:hypothetical protein